MPAGQATLQGGSFLLLFGALLVAIILLKHLHAHALKT